MISNVIYKKYHFDKNKETLAKYRRICYDTYTVRQKQLQKTYIYEAFADIRLRAWQMQMQMQMQMHIYIIYI